MKKLYNILGVIIGLVLLVLFFSEEELSALDPQKSISQYSIRIWNMESGLPTNTVYAIQQTREGYIWVGTQEGLVRFDGIHIHVYNEKTVAQLKSNDIRALCEDRNGILWIGTSAGGLVRYEDGEFTNFPITVYPSLYEISSLCEDNQNDLWVGSFKRGLTYLHNGNFTTYNTKNGLPNNKVHFIQKDSDGELWVSTIGGVVKILKPGIFSNYDTIKTFQYNCSVCLYDKLYQELWIGTFNNGLFCWKNGDLKSYGIEKGISNPTITFLYRDSEKKLWVGTDGGGISRSENGEFNTISEENGLACGYVYSIYEDKEGSLWLGTLDGGLHQLRDGKFTTYTTKEGLTSDYIECIYPHSNNQMLIGTKGGIDQLNPITGTITSLVTASDRTLDLSITCIGETAEGEILVGTWGRGLFICRAGRLIKTHWCKTLDFDYIGCMLIDESGDIWIGTDSGLICYKRKSEKWDVLKTEHGLISNYIEVLYRDSRGRLWIGTDNGLNKLENGNISFIEPQKNSEHHFIRCIYESDDGILWFGADSGLIRIDSEIKHPDIFTTQDGLLENYIYSINEDNNGYIWLGGRSGIFRIKKKEFNDIISGNLKLLAPQWFNEKDGMKNRWCTRTGCKTADGRFWFPTVGGLSMIDPNDIKINTVPPNIILEQLVTDGEIFHLNKKKSKPLYILPGKQRFEFYYTSVSFINPQEIRFKIKLDGYDKKWVSMGTNRTTTYTGLNPGNYTFRVTACNPDGVWNTGGASLSFYIKPYFYQTVWFYLIVGISIVMAVIFLYRLRVRQLKEKEKELSSLVRLRTRDLEERTVELERAHKKLHVSKEIIETKNRNILDSIRYAREIQQAMLPTKKKMAGELNEFYVIYKPKDIVSGDFYWFDSIGDHYFIAVADCTGHGVPGALLSAIGSMMLKDVVRDKHIFDPARILQHLHNGFRSVLKLERNAIEGDTYDGMDMGLCRITPKERNITFAGARRSLLYLDKWGLKEIKGNRQSIGGRQRNELRSFTNHVIEFSNDDQGEGGIMIYLFTDGLTDQHNPKNIKFGKRRLREFLKKWGPLPLQQQEEMLIKALAEHQAEEEQRDDITLIGVRLHFPLD